MNFSTILLLIIGGYILYYAAMIAYDLFLKKEVTTADNEVKDDEIDVSGIANSIEFAPKEIRKTDVIMDDPILIVTDDDDKLDAGVDDGVGDGILNCSDGISVEEFMAAIKKDSSGNPFADIELMIEDCAA